MNLTERKLLSLVKTFIEKVFVPQLPKLDFACQQEWNKFNQVISSDQVSISDLQTYIDGLSPPHLISLPPFRQAYDRSENKSPIFPRSRKESSQDQNTGFNPSKTFGGEKARLMFPLRDLDDQFADKAPGNTFGRDSGKDDGLGGFGLTTQAVLPTL
jgi:hypothetical protein